MKVAPAVTFEVDKVFEQAARVEQILREIEPTQSGDPKRVPGPPRDELRRAEPDSAHAIQRPSEDDDGPDGPDREE
jgi:hypothetical protein